MLIDFVDGGVGRAQFNHLGADLGNKAAIAGAATGGQLGLQAGFGTDGSLRGFHQITGRGQERLAREAPGQVVFERVPVEYGLDALLEGLGRVLGAVAEVEVNHHLAGNHIRCARAAVDVADLPAGGGKEGIALVPFHGRQLGQRRHRLVDGVARQLGVGNVALHAFDGQAATEGATAPIFDHVPRLLDGGGLAHNAPVHALAARAERLADDFGAVMAGAFFIAGQQKGKVQRGAGVGGQKVFHRHNESSDGGFHIAGAAPKQLAIVVGGGEWRAAPLLHRAGGHHIGVARKNQGFGMRQAGAAHGPQVVHVKVIGAAVHAFALKA